MDKYVIAPPSGSTNNSVGAADRPWKEGHFEKLVADDIIAKGPVVDVRAFGAKGDGVTDDTAAIKSALQKYTGVYFPQGKYCVSETITLPVGAHIFGDSENTSVFVIKQDVDLFKVNVECILEKIGIDYDIVSTGNTFEISFNTLTGISDSEYLGTGKYLGIAIKNIKVWYKCNSYSTQGTCFWIKALSSDSTTFPSGNGFWGIDVENVTTANKGYGGYGYFCRCYTYADTVNADNLPVLTAWLGDIKFKNCVSNGARHSYFGAASENDIGDLHYANGEMFIENCTLQCDKNVSFLYATRGSIYMTNCYPYDWQYATAYNGFKRPIILLNYPIRYQGRVIQINGWKMLLAESIQFLNFGFNDDDYSLLTRLRGCVAGDVCFLFDRANDYKRLNVEKINSSSIDVFHWYMQNITVQKTNSDCEILTSGIIDVSSTAVAPFFISVRLTDFNVGSSSSTVNIYAYTSNLQYVKTYLHIYLQSKQINDDGTVTYKIAWNFTDNLRPNAYVCSFNQAVNQDPYRTDASMGKYYNAKLHLDEYSRSTAPTYISEAVPQLYYRSTDVFVGAAPTTGTWRKGERVYQDSPAAGDYIGWVCIASGTPGTWKKFGLIES